MQAVNASYAHLKSLIENNIVNDLPLDREIESEISKNILILNNLLINSYQSNSITALLVNQFQLKYNLEILNTVFILFNSSDFIKSSTRFLNLINGLQKIENFNNNIPLYNILTNSLNTIINLFLFNPILDLRKSKVLSSIFSIQATYISANNNNNNNLNNVLNQFKCLQFIDTESILSYQTQIFDHLNNNHTENEQDFLRILFKNQNVKIQFQRNLFQSFFEYNVSLLPEYYSKIGLQHLLSFFGFNEKNKKIFNEKFNINIDFDIVLFISKMINDGRLQGKIDQPRDLLLFEQDLDTNRDYGTFILDWQKNKIGLFFINLEDIIAKIEASYEITAVSASNPAPNPAPPSTAL
ncbi:uncharacterized protein ASCRUDRAFT_9629 [Ascoidea rubescens DSM 1968]|uniref:PCI domain-containing protein n=1 Tax=Ascoidea rubescens DSM 1968 TaxID=1344418 RepID=A0A1D2VC02_9ASCO|nr:hypothetical protein ASCRUDRAFT_9629 [Ascoidea rubescens DSM 1968]ODV59234.1 hypothetical protein ASCRUDRAFT_9629 [Ascoidea rubescens DSM 1968]